MGTSWKRVLRWTCIGLGIYAAVVAGLIAFGTAPPPPAAPAISSPFADIDTSALPGLISYRARDGIRLSYREYPASTSRVAVLLHGSAGSSVDMHPLALALRAEGITVVVPDIRGHGANRPHGDINYVGQLEDDLADLLIETKRALPGAERTVVGFSSGAAFALRFAANAQTGRRSTATCSFPRICATTRHRSGSPNPDQPARKRGQRRRSAESSGSR